ncbi:type IV pilus biogenesis protein PilM [Siminovitchia sediminis]|uniref:Type IV pilus biogenesis protein PilM n=1 Tax=Siminovitchia sediminis TaxID=1274353 RepID=A0ABW4KNK6_9BACI
MLSIRKSKRVANIVIDDYVIRVAETYGPQLTHIRKLKERPIPSGLIEQGKIVDDLQFYHFMKQLVREWKLKHLGVRFYAPESLVIMRNVEYPSRLQHQEVMDYFAFEIGESIHLPFDQPVFDIHPLPGTETNTGKQKAVLFAAPEEEITKFTHLFEDVSLNPKAVDVRPLGVYRFFHYLDHSKKGETYLFFELNLLSVNISIFTDDQMEFTRFQPLELNPNQISYSYQNDEMFEWTFAGDQTIVKQLLTDQMNELDRIMDFYRYSLHKGEKGVTQIIVTGDHPLTERFKQKVEEQYGLPVTLLKGYLSPLKEEKADMRFIPALGLALKGGA